jgi:hypothetical protein
MENNNNTTFIKANDNRIINEKFIRWIIKLNDCLEVCAKTNGCDSVYFSDTIRICKQDNLDSYNKLNKHFV